MRDLDSYRELFPVTAERVYFNHASLGTLSTRVVSTVAERLAEHSRHGSDATPIWKATQQRTREKMARFLGADPPELAVVKNTPDALGIVATGLDWRPGDRVVISDLEFPANAFPWLNLARRGVETVIVRSEGGRVPTEAVIEAIDERTRLVSLSWVEFSTGYRNDLRTLGRVCHQRGALLAVDAIQGMGALRFDVRELEVDFLGTSSHKWLLGPTGVGWFYCRRDLIEQLEVAVAGQSSYRREASGSFLDYDLPFWPDARRFEPGLSNLLGLAGVEATLDLLMEVGIDRVEAQVKRITDALAEGLVERGYGLAAPREGGQWSGIVSFTSDRYTSEELVHRLESAGVSLSLREGLVRLSPHFYNNDEDVERFFAALP